VCAPSRVLGGGGGERAALGFAGAGGGGGGGAAALCAISLCSMFMFHVLTPRSAVLYLKSRVFFLFLLQNAPGLTRRLRLGLGPHSN